MAVTAWALFVPPFQVTDEHGHFAYVQSLAENGERPSNRDLPRYQTFSTEELWAEELSGAHRAYFDPTHKPAWDEWPEVVWDYVNDDIRPPRDNIRSAGAQERDPPLYYAYEVVPYAASGGDLFDRLFLMRLWSGVLMLITTLGAWLLIGELVGRDRLLQLAGAACVGLQPMATFISAGVNPDAALFAASSMALWLGVRVLRRGATRASVAGLLAAVAAAALAKTTGLALLPGAVYVLVVAARRKGGIRRPWLPLALAAVAAAGASAAALQRDLGTRFPVKGALGDLDAFASYLWQFYLPRAPFLEPYEGFDDLPLWHVWHKTSWAAFGQLEVQFPDAAYIPLAAVTVLVAAAAVAALARGRINPGRAPLVFAGLVAFTLLLGLHWVEFQSLAEVDGTTNQGRYLLPLMPLVGVAVAGGLTNLPARWRPSGAALVLAGMVALQFFSLAAVAGRFYA